MAKRTFKGRAVLPGKLEGKAMMAVDACGCDLLLVAIDRERRVIGRFRASAGV